MVKAKCKKTKTTHPINSTSSGAKTPKVQPTMNLQLTLQLANCFPNPEGRWVDQYVRHRLCDV